MLENWKSNLVRMEENSRLISGLVEHTLKMLENGSHSESPVRYRSVIRNANTLKMAWTRRTSTLQGFVPAVISSDVHFGESFDRIMGGNTAVEHGLDILASAGWPRTSMSGISSIRTRAAEILALLLRQVEREQSLLLLMSRQHLAARHSEAMVLSELVPS